MPGFWFESDRRGPFELLSRKLEYGNQQHRRRVQNTPLDRVSPLGVPEEPGHNGAKNRLRVVVRKILISIPLWRFVPDDIVVFNPYNQLAVDEFPQGFANNVFPPTPSDGELGKVSALKIGLNKLG